MKIKGFTLIELLIVIAIIGILVSVALPSYQAHVLKANRIDAQLAMNEMAVVAEREYARQNDYPLNAAATGVQIPASYNITLVPSTSASGAELFIITATPQGGQSNEECGTMTLNQAGVVTSSDNSNCW